MPATAEPARQWVAGLLGACGESGDQVGLDVEHPLGGQAADVFGDVVAVQQRHAPCDGPVGEVLDQLVPDRSLGDDVDGGDRCRSTSPRMSAAFHADRLRAEPGEHEVGDRVPVDPADLQTELGARASVGGSGE